MFLSLPSITEGTTEKVLQFIMPLKTVYSKNFHFNKQKCPLKNSELLEQLKYLHNYVFKAVLIFRGAPIELIIV